MAKVVADFKAALPGCVVYVYDNRSSDGTGDIARASGAVVPSLLINAALLILASVGFQLFVRFFGRFDVEPQRITIEAQGFSEIRDGDADVIESGLHIALLKMSSTAV